jgi:iron complex transport system substrate-binding protein
MLRVPPPDYPMPIRSVPLLTFHFAALAAKSRRRRHGGGMMRLCLSLLCALACLPARGEIVVTDVSGTRIRLDAPARRIVSLTPHITELLFAAGAGDRVVGTAEYSDFPPAARALPRVGGNSLDLEAIVALKPDLVMGWQSGNAAASVARLRALGLTVHLSEPGRIEDIAGELERIGLLAGTGAAADAAARAFRERYALLAARYSRRPPVAVFYQIWKQPLMTVNGKQIISDAIRLCGGRNVFAQLPILAPTVTVESVIAADPEVIVASGMGDARPEWLDDWRRWTTLTAVARDNLYFVPPDLLQRHTPRILDGAEKLCVHLEAARGKRAKQAPAPGKH